METLLTKFLKYKSLENFYCKPVGKPNAAHIPHKAQKNSRHKISTNGYSYNFIIS